MPVLTPDTYVILFSCVPLIIMIVMAVAADNALHEQSRSHKTLTEYIFITNIVLIVIYTCMFLGAHLIMRNQPPRHRVTIFAVFYYHVIVALSLRDTDPSFILMWTLVGGGIACCAFFYLVTPYFTDYPT